ncbi:DUF1456 family protein [Corallincola spongiicola]|uniref:DUF1456 family protein n=1 Tax=Corallincola spongiicola TaxID=2520508 RepID=A0ABY1WTB6_9GAMM|nr:DUF1456 family protein [Corallincola spongiicola]TAA47767.1 DUF1456 family protein [Corallincola spongiicola]
MTNNDILRRLRYTFELNDSKMIKIFQLAELQVSRAQVSSWLKKDDDKAYEKLNDLQFATFLNGFINLRRGKREGAQIAPEKRLTNNLIFRKLKIALDLKDDDILALMDLSEFSIGKHELSAFFRKPGHKNYRECKDQVLRNFLNGMRLKYHDKVTATNGFEWPVAEDKSAE